jgi:RNA polymerase sigma-70 factor (ECF subfamily)
VDPDRGLVEAAAGGDREAFDELVRRHQGAIVSLIRSLTGGAADAEDLAQDVFVRAWRSLSGFRAESTFRTWLHRIAINVCLNRVAQKQPLGEPVDSTEHLEDRRIEGAQHAMIREERAVVVRKAIASLPERQRATLILRTYHDMSHQEIADVLGSSVGAVKANFFHALKNLKKILGTEP